MTPTSPGMRVIKVRNNAEEGNSTGRADNRIETAVTESPKMTLDFQCLSTESKRLQSDSSMTLLAQKKLHNHRYSR